MADKNYSEASSSSQTMDESLENTVGINVKTLDSQIFSFRVNMDMPVLMLKEKIANAVGVPVGQQRLIFRGRVLKDDQVLSAYHVEDGHTLHLVVRQPVQTESQPGTSSMGTGGNVDNRGSDSAAGALRNRVGVVGQIAHNVVLGPFNIGDQAEAIVPDLSRIIGAVLSSLGVATPVSTGGVGNSSSTNIPNLSSQASETVETNGMQNANGRAPTGNQLPFSPNLFPFQSFNQSQPFHLVIPDSLTTLSAFIGRLEQALSLNGYQSLAPSTGDHSSRSGVPSSGLSGLPTLELLGSVMQRTQCLLSDQAAAALSHIAGRFTREGSSADPVVRGQIQRQAMHVGVAMQHLGALLLELGRTTLMLRMGQSPAESLVNAGPAVYISASGPSPMMVQPALHTSPLYGFFPNSPVASAGVPGQFSVGDTLRNVNIHIHSGTPVAASGSSVAAGTSAEEGSNGERAEQGPASVNRNVEGELGLTRGLPPRTVVAAIPARSPAESSGHVLSVIYPIHVRTQQLNSTSSVSAQGSGPTAEIGPRRDEGAGISHFSESGSVLNVAQPDAHRMLTANGQVHSSACSSVPTDASLASDGQQSVTSVVDNEKDNPCLLHGNVEVDMGKSVTVSSSEHVSESGASTSASGKVKVDGVQSGSDKGSITGLDKQKALSGRSVADSLVKGSTFDSVTDATGLSESKQPVKDDKPIPLGLGLGSLQPKKRSKQSKSREKEEVPHGLPGGHDQQSIATGQQVLQSLVSQANMRGGIGSATSSIGSAAGMGRAQQGHGQGPEIGDSLLGLVRGQGGFDISRMFQQMVPVLSQALGMGSTAPHLGSRMEPQPLCDDRSTPSDRNNAEREPQIDIQPVVERIQRADSTLNVFRAMIESASQLFGGGDSSLDLVDVLGSDEELANEFLELLRRHIHRRSQSDSGS